MSHHAYQSSRDLACRRTRRLRQLNSPPVAHSPAGNTAVAVIGTPFLLVFKTATCVVTLAVAAPAAGILALGVDPYSQGFDYLGSGVAHNCGPPYVLSPSAS